ncbi:hypothetical protein [Rhabdothermincola salaria]|uniref:hypothetical protein n=1 Tax=Rhabdothermincola salaria TaxID=2903142 RepID=UPI001E3929E3|nr:hypothetical protein [Rhabdothermincola salaria]MCD9625265.1 hypothetical protein [Rhabdothermincola salaria]
MSTPVLVLDVGGVILVDAMREVLRELAIECGSNEHSLQTAYRGSGLRDSLWRGQISTKEFWPALAAHADRRFPPAAEMDARIVVASMPLPGAAFAAQHLDRLLLASNHRTEWLMPALAAASVNLDPDRIVCSSAIGVCKPDASFYHEVSSRIARHFGPDARKVFADDQERNLTVPADLGWKTILVTSPEHLEECLLS